MILNRIIPRSTVTYTKYVQSTKSRLFKNGIHSTTANTAEFDNKDRIVWIDMEMTGINVNKDHILEVGCLITDKDLKIVSDDFNIVIHHSEAVLQNMNDWCKVFHAKTGLINESLLSKISLHDAEQTLLAHLKKYVPEKECPMAGNSTYNDRIFLQKYMPLVDEYLHYRVIDVSSIKLLTRLWYTSIPGPKKGNVHRALPDIKESITELQYYRKHVFIT